RTPASRLTPDRPEVTQAVRAQPRRLGPSSSRGWREEVNGIISAGTGVGGPRAGPRGGAHPLRDRKLPAVGGRQEGVPARGRGWPRRPADPIAGARQPAAPRVGGQAGG